MALKKKYETLVKLKTAIVASNTTMKKVATHMGISVTQLSYKVNGKCKFTREDIIGVAEALGIRDDPIAIYSLFFSND